MRRKSVEEEEEEVKEDVMTEGKRNGKAKTERGTEKKIGYGWQEAKWKGKGRAGGWARYN